MGKRPGQADVAGPQESVSHRPGRVRGGADDVGSCARGVRYPRRRLPATFAGREQPTGGGRRQPPPRPCTCPPPNVHIWQFDPSVPTLVHVGRTISGQRAVCNLTCTGIFSPCRTQQYIHLSSHLAHRLSPPRRPLSARPTRSLSLSRRNGDRHHLNVTRVLLTRCLMSCARSIGPQFII